MNNQLEADWSKWKLLALVILIQAVTFATGFYSGHTYWPKLVPQVIQPNYSTVETSSPENITTTNSESTCSIKGNISGKNKIYHVSGGAFFERTQEEMCFETEAEAQAAGFIKSSR